MSKYEGYIDKNLLDVFLHNPNEANMKELVNHVRLNGLSDIEILYLAQGLANSGVRVDFQSKFDIYDIPSTGGPTSLSTLLCPLFLVNLGKKVLKLGVPGRPAGGIDVLAQIEGYNITPTLKQLNSWIQHSGYVHFLAKKDFAPTDALLFKFRKENGAVDTPSLVIASLLSKKLAVGVTHIALDIRVSSFGNFGRTWEDARQNAHQFNKVATLAGMKSMCFLNDGNVPQQPYIGRGEAILALWMLFNNRAENSLENHTLFCFKMASLLSGNKSKPFSLDLIESAFFANVSVQGGSKEAFGELSFIIEKSHQYFIKADENGFLNINLKDIRNAIVAVQEKTTGEFSDPCGVILKFNANQYVHKGDLICSYRCINQYISEFENNLKKVFTYLANPVHYNEFEEIA